MTLERWGVDRYQAPRLDLESIRRLDDTLEVQSRRGMFRIACDDAASFDRELLPMLDALRDPGSAHWRSIRAGRRTPPSCSRCSASWTTSG